ncbi:AAC(3) family N-acetyltransferase [Pseudoalteromonas sp. T1lg65]|uniref:AAC(3) family N-acetyltransferase n=1 Tax=Pseudoalteromonas sp. T1lg65 TaxID=2077101 RepID=UPI003F796A84
MAKTYSSEDIATSLALAGIKSGDNVFVTTSLGMFGFLDGATSQDDINQAFFQALCNAVGERGSIIVPTYSYTFGRHRYSAPAVYDTRTTPAEIGPFPNFFLQQQDVDRSPDPFMSVAIKGPLSSLFTKIGNSSYGYNGIFAKLLGKKVKCLNLGLGPNWTPFIHYADYIAAVPFRYDKLFTGYFSGETEPKQWLYSVPLLSDNATANAHPIGKLAFEHGIWSYSDLGRGRIYACSYDAYFNFVMEHLNQDQWLMAKGPRGDVLAIERERCAIDSAQHFSYQCTERNNLLLAKFAQQFPRYQQIRFETGQNHFDHVVPEGWHVRAFSAMHNEQLLSDDINLVGDYSTSVQGQISAQQLSDHSVESQRFPPYIERDWWLMGRLLETSDDLIDIEIQTETYYAEFITLIRKGSLDTVQCLCSSDFDSETSLKQFIDTQISDTATLIVVPHTALLAATLHEFLHHIADIKLVECLSPTDKSTWQRWHVNGYNPNAVLKLADFNLTITTRIVS